MMFKILCAFLLLLTTSIFAVAATIEESGLSDVQCRIRRFDNGAGAMQDEVLCRFNTVTESGTVVRERATTGLSDLSESDQAAIAACIDIAWSGIYAGEGFPEPTPRPTPVPLEELIALLPTPTEAP